MRWLPNSSFFFWNETDYLKFKGREMFQSPWWTTVHQELDKENKSISLRTSDCASWTQSELTGTDQKWLLDTSGRPFQPTVDSCIHRFWYPLWIHGAPGTDPLY